MTADLHQFRFCIDRGGTFTDVFAEITNTADHTTNHVVMKLLSEDPSNYDDAPREGIRRVIEQTLGKPIPTALDIDEDQIEWLRMGTTVATNALLERKGEPCVLVITRGFADLLQIGNQSRPFIFDLEIKKPALVYSKVIEVDERVRLIGDAVKLKAAQTENPDPSRKFAQGVSGEWVEILKEPDMEHLRDELLKVRQQNGLTSMAVVLLGSYTFHDHELRIGQLARQVGFTQVSLSCKVTPMVRAVPRGLTTCVDAYLTLPIRRYVDNFCAGFQNKFADTNVLFMQSDGGLTPAHEFNGSRAILSGPAGGVVGYARTALRFQRQRAELLSEKAPIRPVIGFDMGGTSTDVSRYDPTSDKFDHVYETQIAGVTIQAPQLAITTVAAGGGSRLFFRSGLFVVGPESSGAHPGPVCYRKGGYLSVTDANLFLGRIIPEHFPHIFGPNKDKPLDMEATAKAFEELAHEINTFITEQFESNHSTSLEAAPQLMTPEEVAHGFLKVANESMCRPIRSITMAKGYDTRNHILACFGGAGPQHACSIARALGMKEIFISRFGGILSAYGMGLADVVQDVQEPCSLEYTPNNLPYFLERLEVLKQRVSATLVQQIRHHHKSDTPHSLDSKDKEIIQEISFDCFLNLRYVGTDYSIMVLQQQQQQQSNFDFANAFSQQYQKEYGFTLLGRSVIVDDIRVRGKWNNSTTTRQNSVQSITEMGSLPPPAPISYSDSYFEEVNGRVQTPVFDLQHLRPGTLIDGPAIIINDTSTIVVLPHSNAWITWDGDVFIRLQGFETRASTELDNVLLSIFAHRFMSIAEQMGHTLQRTSISTNIKERLDFSCALFSPNGGLVANAPHLPVHLGSMSEAVKWQIGHLGSNWKEGEVILTNHPSAGGSHLPDITVITPVYDNGKIVFYVASRGHHADIGGATPGSMPPFSRSLSEEGMSCKSFKLVKDNVFQTEGITELLSNAGTRVLQDNLSDLQAQVAANQKGISLVNELISEYGMDVVVAYMNYIQQSAELAVRDMLFQIGTQNKSKASKTNPDIINLNAEDFMDDGTPIRLTVSINMKEREATFDFSDTGSMVVGNTNAPAAVTYSAVIYSLRCLVKQDIPLNEGCLIPVKIILPDNSILKPADECAVVGGNVLTSQRVTDVIFKAFGACAASQGCMNNFTFGNPHVSYYETICGGAGAGPTWEGQDAVHTHMTNTRITDVEILERRYPVLVHQFSVRRGSGGSGKFRGGDGVVREIEFLEPLVASILSERRVFGKPPVYIDQLSLQRQQQQSQQMSFGPIAPYGLEGGGSGAKGYNLLIKKTPAGAKVFNMGGKNTVDVAAGDRIKICTPGGGGFFSQE